MIVIYRYSDSGKDPIQFGYSYSKRDCFLNFYSFFEDYEIAVILDSSSKESYDFIGQFRDVIIKTTNLGNSGSAKFAFSYAVEKFPGQDIYFAEDDYLYCGPINPGELLEEGLEMADYCSLYDHADKYPNFNSNPNPLITPIGEQTTVFRTESSHWKFTNSTTMTFAVRSDVLEADIGDYINHCPTSSHPHDFQLFTHLINSKQRTLCTPLPGRATHLSPDKQNITPFFVLNERY